MSILIKGLDIPDKHAFTLVKLNGEVFVIVGDDVSHFYTKGVSRFEAVEVKTPHGNLIDISEARHMMAVSIEVDGIENAKAVTKAFNEAMDFLENYPAVVEREE